MDWMKCIDCEKTLSVLLAALMHCDVHKVNETLRTGQ